MSTPTLRQSAGPAATKLLGFGSTQGNRVVTNHDLAEVVAHEETRHDRFS